MARPRKGRDNQLSETLRCRMRPAEYLRIRRAALKANMSLSDYARQMLLSGQVVLQQAHTLDAETFDQLRRIGINLNQAVHRLHATGEIPKELATAATLVETFILGMMG